MQEWLIGQNKAKQDVLLMERVFAMGGAEKKKNATLQADKLC